MQEFIAIDFETANPQRVSACALGYAKVFNYEIVETNGYLIKPIGGHAPFQSKIHGIKEEDTFDKPEFVELYPEIQDIFSYPLVAHSLFDKQVLNALSDHFNLSLNFEYIDSSSIAKEKLPDIKNCKLKTLVKYFGLPTFRHHDAREDAIACASIFIKLCEHRDEKNLQAMSGESAEFKGMIMGILADDEVNYKEAYSLLYWFEDHIEFSKEYQNIYFKTKQFLNDDYLDKYEAEEIKIMLKEVLRDIAKI